MIHDTHQKVTTSHLKRSAYLYVRQSTLRQVFENTESTKRQYALRQHAIALGWAQDQIVVIDTDLGQSGASTDREGFQRLVTAVGMGQAGIVLGLEVSRLARNSTDWHRLLEICALTDTLILDEDGIYDPAHFNDRLLLGLKGTMSEAELHVLRARLNGGILNKAKRGELVMRPPMGFAYDSEGHLVHHPDQQIQHALRMLFETFRRTGSASATVKNYRQQGLLFPRCVHSGPMRGDIIWGQLEHSNALRILHNPRYAGAFVYGRSRTRKTADGKQVVKRLPPDQWGTFLPGVHPGYISWEEYEQNQKRLRENAQAVGADRRKSPPREGPALLQGLILCGQCGQRMTVRYHFRFNRLCPDYVCQRKGIANAEPICAQIPGVEVDRAVSELLVELVNPTTLEVELTVQQELQARLGEADRLRELTTKQSLPKHAICVLIPTIDSSRILWKLTGTTSYVPSRKRTPSMSVGAKKIARYSRRNSGQQSFNWPPTFLGCGTMAAHPTVNANEWSGCYWRMSPYFVANRSPCTCASVEAPARLLSCHSRRRLGSAGPRLQKSSQRSTGCWIIILIKKSPFSSISTGFGRGRIRRLPVAMWPASRESTRSSHVMIGYVRLAC